MKQSKWPAVQLLCQLSGIGLPVDPIGGLKATVSPLQGPGQAPPRLRIRYSHFYGGIFDPLENSPPDPVEKLPGRSGAEPAMQPVWLTAAVPREAAAGDYSATLTVTADGLAPAGWGITDFAGQFGRETFLGMRGFAPWGGDFWPVLRGRSGSHDIIARYNDPSAAHWDPRSTWSTTALNSYQVTYVVTPGREGPVAGVRLEVLREGLQEAEARIFVQNALLDDALRARLGEALARRAKAFCDERTRALRYLSEYSIASAAKEPWPSHFIFDPHPWRERSARLYELAAEVARALGRSAPGRNTP